MVPLFRLYQPYTGDHFYTIDAAERDAALASGSYVYEGMAGWAFDAMAPGRKALYRAYNPQTGQHLFTGGASLYNGLPSPWIREGVAAYLQEAP